MIDFREKRPPARFDVAILGAGFCGSMLAVRLARESDLRVALIEGTGRFGLGAAYSTERSEHLLNVIAGRMSACGEKPNHFIDWMHTNRGLIADVWPGRVSAHDFVPRLVYGRYLRAQLREAMMESDSLCKISQQAIDIEPGPNGFSVFFRAGNHLRARHCVLATGVPRPAQPPGLNPSFAHSRRYVGEPWRRWALDQFHGLRNIVIIGSGLTAVDVALSVSMQHPDASIVMLSRHGRLPQPHLAPLPSAVPLAQSDLKAILLSTTLRSIFQAFRTSVAHAESRGNDWHVVMDAVRPHIQAIWKRLTPGDRRRFLRHARSLWEIHRHRAAPAVASRVATLVAGGMLDVRAGRIVSIDEGRECALVVYQQTGTGVEVTLQADAVVNCTGLHSNLRTLDDPLWQRLAARGLATPDMNGLGIEVDDEGLLVDNAGCSTEDLYSLGFLRRSALYESTAVPELRVQVKQLADRLIAKATSEALAV